MRFTFLGHACHLIDFDGVRVLTDPWLCDPAFSGYCEHDGPLSFAIGDLPGVDIVALTHGHLDHFNAPTLAALIDKGVPVVTPHIRFTELHHNLRRLGFENLQPRDDWEAFEHREVRVTPTPSRGVLDECAYMIEGPGGRFWNGADAPQPPEVIEEIAARFHPIDVAALSHNSFDQPALLGLHSHKAADHGPTGAAATARRLAVPFALAAASNMRWRGPRGDEITRKVIRRSHEDLRDVLEREAPETTYLDLRPGDAWSREGGIERAAVQGQSPRAVENDYIHAFLSTGERFCPAGRPSTEESFERDLPALLRAHGEAALYIGQTVTFDVVGEDAGVYSIDFSRPDAPAERGDSGSPFALRVLDSDWKDLFERRISWQVLLVSDRLEVTRFRAGLPPDGLHFAYGLQAIFP